MQEGFHWLNQVRFSAGTDEYHGRLHTEYQPLSVVEIERSNEYSDHGFQ